VDPRPTSPNITSVSRVHRAWCCGDDRNARDGELSNATPFADTLKRSPCLFEMSYSMPSGGSPSPGSGSVSLNHVKNGMIALDLFPHGTGKKL